MNMKNMGARTIARLCAYCLPVVLLIPLVMLPLAANASSIGSVSAGFSYTMALKTDGSLWAWGANSYGQLGDGSTTDRSSPVLIGRGYSAVSAKNSHTLALKDDGSLWAWGLNNFGQLGDGTTINRVVPVMIGAGYSAVASGLFHSMALKADGSLWAWGMNFDGQLGDGSTIAHATPVQVSSGFSTVSSGYDHTVAVKFDGSLWVWGAIQLADGTLADRTTPMMIGSGYSAVSSGYSHSLALKSGGNLWAWGANFVGEVGDGSQTDRWSPVLIGSGYASVKAGGFHTLAMKLDGSLWAWGSNLFGQLGDGTLNNSATPLLIGDGYIAMAAGTYHTVALKLDGSLWSWGQNSAGALGDGTTDSGIVTTSPRQVIGLNLGSASVGVVEFYNTILDNYFITADLDEAASIDNGSAGPGWSRTGINFRSGGAAPVCRFYGSVAPGPNSHFYTVDADECSFLMQLQAGTPVTQQRWNFESLDYFSTAPTGGSCPGGTVPVYRAYNNGFARKVDSNHRLTSSLTAIQQVVTRGWINEGVAMCAPI